MPFQFPSPTDVQRKHDEIVDRATQLVATAIVRELMRTQDRPGTITARLDAHSVFTAHILYKAARALVEDMENAGWDVECRKFGTYVTVTLDAKEAE